MKMTKTDWKKSKRQKKKKLEAPASDYLSRVDISCKHPEFCFSKHKEKRVSP
jgi:hypothetical protein